MSIQYQYNKPGNYVITTVTGTVSVDQVAEYVNDILSDDSIKTGFYEIVDFTGVKDFDFGYYQSDKLINLIAKLKNEKQYQGSCLVADKDLTKGMSNIFKVVGEDKKLSITIFSTLDEAIDYVSSKSV
jgi:hypothetical protein